jgi:hypothetical protein
MENKLVYRRQFIMAREVIEELNNWSYMPINDLHLYAHPDLEITMKEQSSIKVILLGYIFDPACPEKSNNEIISDLIEKISGFDELIAGVKPLAGRYVLICKDNNNFLIMHDTRAMREIYYCTEINKIVCASQPNFISRFSSPHLGVTQNENIINFYKYDMLKVRNQRFWIGEESYYQDVKHLMPNHFLDLKSLTAKRYWPNRKLEEIKIDLAVEQSCKFLKGIIKAVTNRYDTMMAVTSGIDSRSLMAASKECKDQIYYFINREPALSENSADIYVPKKMFKSLGIPFHIHEIESHVDENFKKIFLDNVFLSSELILPTIYNVYYRNLSTKINLLGLGEIARDFFGKTPKHVDGYYLARTLKYKSSEYAVMQCEKWLNHAKDIAEKYNVDLMKLFDFEVLTGNWAVVGNSESDIAMEEFDPYNSHFMYEIMLSLEKKYQKSGFFEAIIGNMWPELLQHPFNPPENTAEFLKETMIKCGIFHPIKEILYLFDKWRYMRNTKN